MKLLELRGRKVIMKVHEVMTTDPATCGPEEAVMYAAAIMWHRDCGAVPVVDGNGCCSAS
jgi:CBS domain-containing protein